MVVDVKIMVFWDVMPWKPAALIFRVEDETVCCSETSMGGGIVGARGRTAMWALRHIVQITLCRRDHVGQKLRVVSITSCYVK
jgi:hypothetical protein